MENENNSYRIRTVVGSDSPNSLNVKLNQTFEFLNILSLKIGQQNLYKMPAAPYGVIIGRVLLGGKSFGIPNAKVSVFIPKDGSVFNVKDDILYAYSSVNSTNYDGVRYNLLPSYVDEACHQNVGTMFEKQYVLDNNDVIRIFDKYYTYTTTTNEAGDYMIYGVPVGQHTLHVDIDLSDIGRLSVRPHDMMAQGYSIDQFESPNKFKTDKNLNILPQIKTQDKPVYVYPFWGDTTEDDTNALITRADIEVDYKFEPTAVFIGSIVTDKGSNSISHKCIADDLAGKMSELTTGEGKIEMIRKTFDGKVEEFSVKGNRVIDGDGVWCYQIPMNLDYVTMDEFGDIVPTDNPDTGIPTRARVRFRISLDEDPMDDSARKRARFLVPNNPRLTDDYPNFRKTHEADYEFGTFTKEESYRDMFWNNVYTVKSYVPRLQKRSTANTKKFTGIKMTNHSGDNNPMPYNNLSIKMNFMYRFMCVLMTVFFNVLKVVNDVLTFIGKVFIDIGLAFENPGLLVANALMFPGVGILFNFLKDKIAAAFIKAGLRMYIPLNSDFCEDGDISKTYILGNEETIGKWLESAKKACKYFGPGEVIVESDEGPVDLCQRIPNSMDNVETRVDVLMNCVQNALAQENEVTSFNFHNDWVNGVLYAPLWYRKIKPKRKVLFGLIKTSGKDDWCDGNSSKMAGGGIFAVKGLKLFQTCAQERTFNTDTTRQSIVPIPLQPLDSTGRNKSEANCYGYKCHRKTLSLIQVDKGIIIRKETKYGEYVYYYKAVEYDTPDDLQNILNPENIKEGEVKILFATDIVLLGSLNDCDVNGVPQFFKHLIGTTYQMPPDLVSMTWAVDDSSEDGITITAEDEFDETGAIQADTIHTEYTGADYGNTGSDQWYKPPKRQTTATHTTYVGDNEYDNGGLFYNLTCNFSYVKPKCCVNLSRICELGVSLDQSTDFIGEDGLQTTLPPDGFVSYDELYNMDARAMFATMNGNNLREKHNLKTGFPVYDFNYLYPENFDGTLARLMGQVHPTTDDAYHKPILYYGNKNLEKSSNAYLRFRYGFDREKFKVSFYDSKLKLGFLYALLGRYAGLEAENRRRFPRYENSFYFYFGLKHGKTAIEKFRSQFYAECRNDAPSESLVVMDYSANSWCNDSVETFRDGYLSFDLSNIELPCAISLDERTEGGVYDAVYTDIKSYKLYIGNENQALEADGYEQLYVDGDNRQKPSDDDNLSGYTAPTIANGMYIVTIVDANGETYRQNVLIDNAKLKYSAMSYPFTLTNEDLQERFPDTEEFSSYYRIAADTSATTSFVSSNTLREIGGYITISGLSDNGFTMFDDFIINVDSFEELPGYTGSEYKVVGGTVTVDGVPPLSVFGGSYSFGVPKADSYYKITVTQYCANTSTYSKNSVSTKVFVAGPRPFRMYVNGIDTALLSKFTTGFVAGSDGVISRPYDGYNEMMGIDTERAKGWLEIGNVGVNHVIKFPPEGGYIPFAGEVENAVQALIPHNSDVYAYTDEYIFRENNVHMDLMEFSEVPVPSQMGLSPVPKYIKVKANSDPMDSTYYIWEYVEATETYVKKYVNGQPVESLTLKEYFETNDYDVQCSVISAINDVIQRRLDLVSAMRDAFYMYDADASKVITVTYDTDNVPVKTLIYYDPDRMGGNIGIQHTSLDTAGYIILDPNKEENTITSFYNPTITFSPKYSTSVFFKNSGMSYKLPTYCAIKNSLGTTIPREVGTVPFGMNSGTVVSSTFTPVGITKMFGFHILDKRPSTALNVWVPVKNYPIYWPDINTANPSPVSDFSEGGYISVDGCVSGFFFNGASTSPNCKAEFITSRIGDTDFLMYTVTIKTMNGVSVPDESAMGTKRVMYREVYQDVSSLTYNDFVKTDSPFAGFGADSIDTGVVDTTNRYMRYGVEDEDMVVTDSRYTLTENLNPSAVFGIPEDTLVERGALVKPVFNGVEGVVNYVFFNAKNPIFQRVYDNSPELIVTPYVKMTYGWNLPPNTGRIPDGDNVIRVYAVGCTSDGKFRAISPTYEVAPVKAKYTEASDGSVRVTIRYAENGPITDYYLRKYPHYIIFDCAYKEYIDEFDQAYTLRDYTLVSDLRQPMYETLPSDGEYRYENYVFTQLAASNVMFPHIYVKDITGIRRVTETY